MKPPIVRTDPMTVVVKLRPSPPATAESDILRPKE